MHWQLFYRERDGTQPEAAFDLLTFIIQGTPATVLQSTPKLEHLASVYSLAANSPLLTDFERSAILRGIEAELTDRAAARKYAFRFGSESEMLQRLQCAGAICDKADAAFCASLIKAFDATYTGAAVVGKHSVDCLPEPLCGLSPQETMEFYAADLEDAVRAKYIDYNYQPPVFHPTRSSTRKKKRKGIKLPRH